MTESHTPPDSHAHPHPESRPAAPPLAGDRPLIEVHAHFLSAGRGADCALVIGAVMCVLRP